MALTSPPSGPAHDGGVDIAALPPFPVTLSLGTLGGTAGFVINGAGGTHATGFAVSGAGDVNGDGIGDLVIGASSADTFAGRAYVIFGRSDGLFDAAIDLCQPLPSSVGFVIEGSTAQENAGVSVSRAGDLNGDGIDDLLIGARMIAPGTIDRPGGAYVVFGRSGGFDPVIELSAFHAVMASEPASGNGLMIVGKGTNTYAGQSVNAAGDVNGDGIDDVIIGARRASETGDFSGAAYVVFGSGGLTAQVQVTDLDGANGFAVLSGSGGFQLGRSVSGAGDVNGDGIEDVIIGAPGVALHGQSTGAAYVVFGRSDGFAASLDLSALAGGDGFAMYGAGSQNYTGFSVSGAGDVNGDGIDDLLVGAYGASPNGAYSGRTYLVFGRTSFPDAFELTALAAGDGVRIDGPQANARSGRAVSGAGDIDNDGIDDILIGAHIPNRAYVVFGRETWAPEIDLPTTSAIGFAMHGVNANDDAGQALGFTGDVNGDGIDDLIIGAPRADPYGRDGAGAAYVVFGRQGDIVAPDTTIASGPSGPTASTSAAFSFTTDDGSARFEVSFDGAAFVPVSVSTQSYSGLADGTHTFAVRARDPHDNVDPTPAAHTFRVDTIAPDTTILTGPAGPTASNDPHFDFGASEGEVTYEVALDGGSFTTVAGASASFVDLPDGTHTLQVRARDAVGQVDDSPAQRAFTIDTTPPGHAVVTSFTEDTGAIGDGVTSDRTLTLGGTGDPLTTVRVFRDATPIGTTTAGADGRWSFVDPATQTIGPHRFAAQGVDALGNAAPVSAPLEVFVVDGAGSPSAGSDIVVSGPAASIVQGLEGNDTIFGLAGNDTLRGNNGNDWLFGGDGADRLETGNGADTARGGNANDSLYGENGNDRLYGENGNDRIEAGAGADIADGGPGADTLYGGAEGDTLLGDQGADQLYGDAGPDWLHPGIDNVRDSIVGTLAQLAGDTIEGFIDGVPTVPGADVVLVQAMTNAQRAQIDGDLLDAQGRLFLPGGGVLTFLGHAGAEVDAVFTAGGVQIWLV